MGFHTIKDPDFIGDIGRMFDKIRTQGASTGCKVAVTSLSRDGTPDPESGIILRDGSPGQAGR